MSKKIILYLLLFLALCFFNLTVGIRVYAAYRKNLSIDKILSAIGEEKNGNQFSFASVPYIPSQITTEISASDGRVANLKRFFRQTGSPLYSHSDLIVKVSDYYGFDYRLLPAIAMQESNECLHIPAGSYNCWGWGIYGSTVTRFPSYDEAIRVVAKGINDEYIKKGLVTASSIMAKYNPISTGTWAFGVNYFLRVLE